MGNILLIDFGASRIKSAVASDLNIFFETTGSIIFKDKAFNPFFFYNSLFKHLNFYRKIHKINFSKIYVCSEMHGFFLTNTKNKKKNTLYYSWRYFSKKKIKKNYLSYLDKNLYKKTGLKLRDGLPIKNFLSIYNFNKYNLICGVAESLCVFGGKYNYNLHSTYAQSTGFFDLKNKFFFKKFFRNKVYNKNELELGFVLFKGIKIKILGGYGDLQCATLGSNLKKNFLLLNLGTGSQIISKIKSKKISTNIEKRIFFENKTLYCFTHIPSGRMLNFFSKKIDSKFKTKNYFWNYMKHFVPKNQKYRKKVINFLKINYNSKHFKNFLNKNINMCCENLFYYYIWQYIILIKNNFNISNYKKIYLSGGIPNKIPFIKNFLSKNLRLPVKTNNSLVDDTINGLLMLSR